VAEVERSRELLEAFGESPAGQAGSPAVLLLTRVFPVFYICIYISPHYFDQR